MYSRCLLAGCLFGLAGVEVLGQAPQYPRVNTAINYEVDPQWPQRPAHASWGHVPGIAVDAQDHIYVFTRGNPPVQVYDAQGKYLRGWGDKTIKSAHHIHVVEQYTPDGQLLRTLGVKGKAGRDKAHFNMPTDMAIAPGGDIFVSDGYGNARIVHLDKDGKFVREWGELGSSPGQFSIPHSIAMDSQGRIYVADRNNVRIQVFDQQGKLLDEWRDLVVPWGLWVTPKDELWVCGSSPMQWRKEDGALGCPPKDQVFMKFNASGKLLQLFALPKGLDGLERVGEVNWVHALAFDSRGHMYVGDIIGKRAQKFRLRQP